MTPYSPWRIQLSRMQTKWEWTVVCVNDEDDFIYGQDEDYTKACAAAREALDDVVFRRIG